MRITGDVFSPSDSFGSAFTFDFVRNSSRPKRPLLRDMKSAGRFGRNPETLAAECNGNKSPEMQLRLQSQQEELSQMQQEQVKLREELASQKVQLFMLESMERLLKVYSLNQCSICRPLSLMLDFLGLLYSCDEL